MKDLFNNLKINLVRNDHKKQSIRNSVISYNYNVNNQLDFNINENKSEYNAKYGLEKNQIDSKITDNNQIKINNFFNNINSTFNKKEENKYVESSEISSESFDYSNKPVNNIIQGKRMDSLVLLKDKNLKSLKKTNINDTTINVQKLTKNIHNNNNINVAPKKKNPIKIEEDIKDNKKEVKKKLSFKFSNLKEILKIKKLNKDMVHESNYFENKFSFFYYIVCSFYKKKKEEEFKNLYLLISFRKRLLSENFIFQQHIINLLLGKKCGINPNEIKHLV